MEGRTGGKDLGGRITKCGVDPSDPWAVLLG